MNKMTSRPPILSIQQVRNPVPWSLLSFIVAAWMQAYDFHDKNIALFFVVIGVVVIIYSAIQWLGLPSGYRVKYFSLLVLRFSGKISLPCAAAIAYTEARARRSILAGAAERLGVDTSPDGILDYVATYFGVVGADVWGRRLPAIKSEIIPPEVLKRGHFSCGASLLTLQDPGGAQYVDLQVRSKDIKEIVQKLPQIPPTSQ